MAVPDVENLSLDELRELIQTATLAYKMVEANQQISLEARRLKIFGAISTLEGLLGPENAPPNLENIRGVLQFSNEEMVANPGIAFRLIFQGLEILTKTTLDVANVVAVK